MKTRLLTWAGVPVLSYLCMHALIAMEEDVAFIALLAAAIAAVLSGGYVRRKGGKVWEAALAGAWFPTALVAGRVYWSLGMSSPGSAAQQIVAFAGWLFAPPAAALAVLLLPSGVLGFYVEKFNFWWEGWKGKNV